LSLVLGAVVLITIVPATAPKDDVLTGMLKEFASIGVAINVPLNAAQAPVPPEIVTVGTVAVLNP
jgi:hypothetical protein